MKKVLTGVCLFQVLCIIWQGFLSVLEHIFGFGFFNFRFLTARHLFAVLNFFESSVGLGVHGHIFSFGFLYGAEKDGVHVFIFFGGGRFVVDWG